MADATPAAPAPAPATAAAAADASSTDDTPVKRGRGRPKGSFKVKRDENGKPIPGSRIDPSASKSTTTPATTRSSSNGNNTHLSTALAAKRKAQDNEDDGIVRTGKRGRPPGTGKKQILARKIKSLQAEEDEDSDEGVVSLKVIIERCTTCTQYKTNSNRIFRLVKQLYPEVECEDVPVTGSKGFEIFVIKNGGKKVQVWSGKAHAPP
ncbi:hypothetical protein DFQ26_009239, partial [Actinomortierella ambigua]